MHRVPVRKMKPGSRTGTNRRGTTGKVGQEGNLLEKGMHNFHKDGRKHHVHTAPPDMQKHGLVSEETTRKRPRDPKDHEETGTRARSHAQHWQENWNEPAGTHMVRTAFSQISRWPT